MRSWVGQSYHLVGELDHTRVVASVALDHHNRLDTSGSGLDSHHRLDAGSGNCGLDWNHLEHPITARLEDLDRLTSS